MGGLSVYTDRTHTGGTTASSASHSGGAPSTQGGRRSMRYTGKKKKDAQHKIRQGEGVVGWPVGLAGLFSLGSRGGMQGLCRERADRDGQVQMWGVIRPASALAGDGCATLARRRRTPSISVHNARADWEGCRQELPVVHDTRPAVSPHSLPVPSGLLPCTVHPAPRCPGGSLA